MESIEEILSADPHVIEVIPGEEWDFPEIDYSLFDPEAKLVQRSIEYLQEALSSHYILDDFTDHWERRGWKQQMIIAHGGAGGPMQKFLAQNSLKRGVLIN